MKSLTEIKNLVQDLASRINAPKNLLPTFSAPIGDATPNVEVGNSGLYHFVISERGTEYERKTTPDLDDLLYWIFSSVTFSMACDYELKHRIEGADSRRTIFARQQDLLGLLNKNWEARVREEHGSILKINPFDDMKE